MSIVFDLGRMLMPYNRVETTLNGASEVIAVRHPTQSDAQLLALMQRVEQRFADLQVELEDMREQRDQLQAQLDHMRLQRDEWQGKAERLWIDRVRRIGFSDGLGRPDEEFRNGISRAV